MGRSMERPTWGDDDILEPLGSLLTAMPRDPHEPGAQFEILSAGEAREAAEQALSAFLSGEYDELPPLHPRLMTWSYLVTHPRQLREYARSRHTQPTIGTKPDSEGTARQEDEAQ